MVAWVYIGHPHETTIDVTATTTSFQFEPRLSQEDEILYNHDRHIEQMEVSRRNWNAVKRKHHHHLIKWRVGG